jgi:hypothetical protein
MSFAYENPIARALSVREDEAVSSIDAKAVIQDIASTVAGQVSSDEDLRRLGGWSVLVHQETDRRYPNPGDLKLSSLCVPTHPGYYLRKYFMDRQGLIRSLAQQKCAATLRKGVA